MYFVNNKRKIDFNALWNATISELKTIDQPRLESVFQNFKSNPEYVCRKYGIVSVQDIERLRNKLKNKNW